MNTKKGWLERREFERVKDVLKIAYYPVDESTNKALESDDYKDTTIEKIKSDRSKNNLIQAMTDDISKGGLSIITDEPLALNSKVIIDLFLPKISKPVKILTEVKNIEGSVKGSGSFKAGLKTLSMSKSDLSRVENYLISQKFK
jgi:c-di-GMP-binding flagellar brake protein YcgR